MFSQVVENVRQNPVSVSLHSWCRSVARYRLAGKTVKLYTKGYGCGCECVSREMFENMGFMCRDLEGELIKVKIGM